MENKDIIFFDAEFTGNEEILELAVMDGTGKLLYHRYFKPITSKKWNTDIHHITPEMVANEKSFYSCIQDIQPIFDRATFLSGFSVNNDIRVLEDHGIKGIRNKQILDIHDYFWLMNKDNQTWNLDSIPSLVKCSQHLGIDFKEENAHSASFDTELTYKCYELLNQAFKNSNLDNKDLNLSPETIIEKIESAKLDYYRQKAMGYIRVYKNNKGYHLHFNYINVRDSEKQILEVKVENRYKAEYEIRKLLKKKADKKIPYIYNLTSKDLETIKNYRNTYNKEEADLYKNLMKNKDKISF